eukprot:440146-Lingulodinium_polyedra.AAC.1
MSWPPAKPKPSCLRAGRSGGKPPHGGVRVALRWDKRGAGGANRRSPNHNPQRGPWAANPRAVAP